MWVSFNTDFGRKEKSFLCFFTRKRSKKKRKSFSYLFVLKLHISVSWNRNIFITRRGGKYIFHDDVLQVYSSSCRDFKILSSMANVWLSSKLPLVKDDERMAWHGMRLEHLLIFTVMWKVFLLFSLFFLFLIPHLFIPLAEKQHSHS